MIRYLPRNKQVQLMYKGKKTKYFFENINEFLNYLSDQEQRVMIRSYVIMDGLIKIKMSEWKE